MAVEQPWDRRAAALATVTTGPDGLPLTLADYRAVFEAVLPEATRGYYEGGGADEITLRDNVEAWQRITVWPRVLRGIDTVDTSIELLGHRLAHPFVVAPTAFHGLATPEAEVDTARGAHAADALFVLSTLAHTGPRELAAGAPESNRWFQLYVLRDRGLTRSIVDAATECGFSAIVVTVDLPPAGRRERELRTGFTLGGALAVPSIAATGTTEPITMFDLPALFDPSLTWADIEEVATWTDLPIVVKGLLHPQDAVAAVEHGAAAVVVSNHGGRQMDGIPAGATALAPVADAVQGRIPLLVDGGVRRGTDAIRARALGADAVLVGRPILYGLATAGAAGAAGVIGLLRAELENGLALAGCARFDEVDAGLLRPDA